MHTFTSFFLSFETPESQHICMPVCKNSCKSWSNRDVIYMTVRVGWSAWQYLWHLRRLTPVASRQLRQKNTNKISLKRFLKSILLFNQNGSRTVRKSMKISTKINAKLWFLNEKYHAFWCTCTRIHPQGRWRPVWKVGTFVSEWAHPNLKNFLNLVNFSNFFKMIKVRTTTSHELFGLFWTTKIEL